MATSGSGSSGDVFDVRRIRRLVELMKEHDLSEVDLKQAGQRVRIRRGYDPRMDSPAVVYSGPTQAAVPSGPTSSSAPAQDDANVTFVRSQMVGTFYLSPNPDSPPFVKVGDTVGPDTTVCIIEAMKVFNEITAECSGKVLACLVKNGDPVEFNQPLFKIDSGV